MTYAEIYQKIDEEIEIVKGFIKFEIWKKDKSEFFEEPKMGTLQNSPTSLSKIISPPNNQSGIYLFVCNSDTSVSSIKLFNTGKSLALLRAFDNDKATIKKDDVLYIGECNCFSSRLSAHLDHKKRSRTYGLHLYTANRKTIYPEKFKILLFPLKNSFYPNGCSEEDRQVLRELIEIKLKAFYVPLIGK